MTERQIEMLWRCSSCGQRNLGRFMVCQGCGSPKDESEEYEMPGDTSAAATVNDPALLRMARASANWRCRYCGSDQRTLEGACAQCGAIQGEGRSTAELAPRAAVPVRAASLRRRSSALPLVAATLAVCVLALALCGLVTHRRSGGARSRPLGRGVRALELPFHEESATVTGLRWRQIISVDRWQIMDGEGFEEAKPTEAFAVRPVGQRFHHNERVLAGYDTQSYSETVPDGTRSESYTAQEACGQDCTPRPQTCREKCTPNKNGFATCRNECTGGGQDCRTKYCTVTKTREVPQTKAVTKTRQVPRYRDEARNATWYAWKLWGWKLSRTLEKRGTSTETIWPGDEEVKLGKGLGQGEKERTRKVGFYDADLDSGGTRRELHLGSADELARYPKGSSQRLRIWNSGRVEAL